MVSWLGNGTSILAPAFCLIQLFGIYNFNINTLRKLTTKSRENKTYPHVLHIIPNLQLYNFNWNHHNKNINNESTGKKTKQKAFSFHGLSFTFGNKRSLNTSKL